MKTNEMLRLLLAASVAGLVACQVSITVPEGGYVVSRTGDSDCPENTQCSFDVENGSEYGDTFTAVANDGFEFLGWKEGHGYLCSGAEGACEAEDVPTFLTAQDIEVFLEPVFRPVATDPVPESPINDTGAQFIVTPDGILDECSGPYSLEQDCNHGRDSEVSADDTDGTGGFQFIKLDFSGIELAVDTAEWSCVADQHTNLVWEVKSLEDGPRHKDAKFRWGGVGSKPLGTEYYDDWNQLVDHANDIQLCGYSDWRVPENNELFGIVDFNFLDPAIDTRFFPHTESYTYWTVNPVVDAFENTAWGVYFHQGSMLMSDFRFMERRVRLVRGGNDQ